ncbi:hypothetical protein HOH87_00210 [bacterium]|jgi:hypothetical protein|nr:hypothetical protein [bacterium]
MKNKLIISLFVAVFILGGLPLYASHHKEMSHKHEGNAHAHGKMTHKENQQVPKNQLNKEAPHQIKVRVDGIVCSFCAYGAEKNLSKLSFIDKSYYGDDGVFVDIEKGIVTMALTAKKKADVKSILKALKKGGYTPRELSFVDHGNVIKTIKLDEKEIKK